MKISFLSGQRRNEQVPITMSPITIGRGDHNNIVVPDAKASREHARVYYSEDGRWYLQVLSPANPVFSSQQPYTQILQLQPGMIVQIGETHLQFDLAPAGAVMAPVAPAGVGGSSIAANPPLAAVEPDRPAPILPILLGIGGALLVLLLIFFVTDRDGPVVPPNGTAVAGGGSISAVQTSLAAASAGPSVTGTIAVSSTVSVSGTLVMSETLPLTGTLPPAGTATLSALLEVTGTATGTATPTSSPTPSTTPTAVPTPTPQPIAPALVGAFGAFEEQPYDPSIIADTVLDERGVPVDERDKVVTIAMEITNNQPEAAVATSDLALGAYLRDEEAEGGFAQKISFVIPSEDVTIEPNETQTMTWLVVLDQDAQIAALAVSYQGETIFQMINEEEAPE